MNAITKMRDGFLNFVSRLGTQSDKAAHNTYVGPQHDQVEINAAYRTSWFRKIVEAIPDDEVREWRTWQADTDEQTTPIEDEEKRHNILQKVHRARILARKDGGAALYMSLPGAPADPVDQNSIGKGALQYVTLFTRYEITPTEKETDVLSPNFGNPKSYTLGTEQIHPSRIIRFAGPDKGDESAWDGWGDSLWETVRKAVLNSDSAAAGVASLIQEAKLDIIAIPGLMAKIGTAEYESRLTSRFVLANTLKSINNVLLIDGGDGEGKGGEKFEQKTLNFAGFPDIMDRFDIHMSGICGIPATRLLGRSPAGMNATGESDMRNYYDGVRSGQERVLTPILNPLDEALIRSALGSRPPNIYYEWNPLYSLDEKEAAIVEKTYAEALKIRVETGTVDESVLAKGELNRMVESGRYPGIEAAIEESSDEDGIKDPEEQEAKEIERMNREAEIAANSNRPARTAANDALPRSLYVRRDVVNAAEIREWAEAQGISDLVPDLHVTLIYSTDPVDWIKAGNASEWTGEKDGQLTIPAGGPRTVEPLGDMGAVIMFASSLLTWRHREIVEAGATHGFADYQPHISLTKAKTNWRKVEPYRGKIVLGPEIFEEVKP